MAKLRTQIKDESPEFWSFVDKRILDCLKSKGELNDCEAPKTPSTAGITAAFDADIQSALQVHNCARVKEDCFLRITEHDIPFNDYMNAEAFARMRDEAASCSDAQAKYSKGTGEQTLQSSISSRNRTQGFPKIFCQVLRETSDRVERCFLAGAVGLDNNPVNCMEHDTGQRDCLLKEPGQSFEQIDETDPETAQSVNTSIGYMHKPGGHCSGTVLGDGRTFRTAGHCRTDGGDYAVRVLDRHGTWQNRLINCPVAIDEGNQDAMFCQLDQPIEAFPTHAMIRNDNLPDCSKTGWVWQCPTSGLENLSNTPATIISYPARYPLTRSTANLRYDSIRQVMFSNAIVTGGSSGAPTVIDFRGDMVDLGAVARTNKATIGDTYSSITDASRIKDLGIEYLTQNQAIDAEPLFRQLELSALGE